MSTMRKAVDGATKPKRAAPKAKYIDPIVQATFSQDGQLQEVVRTLASRMRDPNTTVVFKSLIVLHTLMRSGSIDSVFPYLASSSVSLSLSSSEASNVAAYGQYLAARIKAYGNLKRDAIRDKSDRRNANRMRKLSVEQGLLRETREIQRMIAALVDAKFYADDVDDDVSMTALRLLVKDLLVLFTIVNEGVINILENFFALSKPDCETALKIYKTFCRDTEKVVAYLGTAKKLYNVLNIPIPNLKHAPLSLANSLEEYLRDPNFEQNRQEYKEVKRIADGGAPRATPPQSSSPAPAPASASAPSTSAPAPPSSSQPAPKSFTDFFESIETAQTPMFAASPSPSMGFFPQPTGAPFNPFMGAQPTGGMVMMGMQQPFAPQMTGVNPFLQAQPTGFGAAGMGMLGSPQMQMQPQMTGFTGGLAPQITGAVNPFRQSMMMTGGGAGGAPNPFAMQQTGMMPSSMAPPVAQVQPQATGMGGGSPFGAFGGQSPQQQQQPQATGNPFGARPQSMMPQATGNPFGQQQQQQQQPSSPAPGAPPLGAPSGTSSSSPFPPSSTPAPLVAQKTGARNPFAPAPGTVIPQTAPPQPKQPSMYELAMLKQQQTGYAQQQQQPGQGLQPQQTGYQAPANEPSSSSPFGQQQAQQQPPKKQDAFSAFLAEQQAKRDAEAAGAHQGAAPLLAQKTGGLMASIATDLARGGSPGPGAQGAQGSISPFGSTFAPSSSSFSPAANGVNPSSTALSTPFSSLSISTSLSPSLTGAPASQQQQHSFTASPLSAQPTGGFAGSSVRAFQPSSSFGSKLASEISASALSPQATGLGGASPAQGQGQGQGGSASQQQQQQQPLQPQATGAFNPSGGTRLPPLNTPLSAGLTAQPTGTGMGSGFSGGGGAAGGSGGVATASLI
ncbi:ENTH domain-containing protein [Rhodotorula diobovata]|uniref:ENTH domain-containing protein n=1 Tax=Rhodotorula diobovata TaxID=5288 RepID=A0A5C5FWM2_9BASI|nr:ENTH domain-containing protein [Rhodotorula diobovata]